MNAKPPFPPFDMVRTTVTLPARLVERTQAFIDRGLVPNRSAAIAAALESFLDAIERHEIDRAFDALASDEALRQLSVEVESAFADSDWEAWRAAESSD